MHQPSEKAPAGLRLWRLRQKTGTTEPRCPTALPGCRAQAHGEISPLAAAAARGTGGAPEVPLRYRCGNAGGTLREPWGTPEGSSPFRARFTGPRAAGRDREPRSGLGSAGRGRERKNGAGQGRAERGRERRGGTRRGGTKARGARPGGT